MRAAPPTPLSTPPSRRTNTRSLLDLQLFCQRPLILALTLSDELFCKEQRPRLPPLRNTERERLLGQMWKALSFAGRARWEVLGGKRATGTLVSTPALSPSATRCLGEDKAVDGAVRAVLAFQQASDEATMTGNEAVVVDLSDARRSGIVRLQCSIKWAPDYWILNTADGPVCIPLAPTMSS